VATAQRVLRGGHCIVIVRVLFCSAPNRVEAERLSWKQRCDKTDEGLTS